MTDDARATADAFAKLFPAIYLAFHRRDAKRSELTGASRAVLAHLSLTGPLTIGEAAKHLGRAQSVVSEIVDHLAKKGVLERIRDPRDRRRTLVWLTEQGLALMDRDQDVLERDLVAAAAARMSPADRAALLRGARALLEASEARRTHTTGDGR